MRQKPEGHSKSAPKELNITTPSVSKIIIDASESTVTLNGQSYTAVEATTADNTLIVGKDVTVADLTVKKGNVENLWNGKQYQLYRQRRLCYCLQRFHCRTA